MVLILHLHWRVGKYPYCHGSCKSVYILHGSSEGFSKCCWVKTYHHWRYCLFTDNRLWITWKGPSLEFGWGPSLRREIVGRFSDPNRNFDVGFITLSSVEESEWYLEQRYGESVFKNHYLIYFLLLKFHGSILKMERIKLRMDCAVYCILLSYYIFIPWTM